jgi:hypothetical protein
MRSNKIANESGGDHKRNDELKDEVYRQMFRVEEGRAGAAGQLAIALLRAWMSLDNSSRSASDRSWLRKICPLCIGLLQTAADSARTGTSCGT